MTAEDVVPGLVSDSRMTVVRLLTCMSVFWSIALAAIAISHQRDIPELVKGLQEEQGVVLSERSFRYSSSVSRPDGNPNEREKYEVVIRYAGNKIWRYVGTSGAPVNVGESVQLLVSKTDPREIYLKDRLLEKANPFVYLLAWMLFVPLPWALAFWAGFLSVGGK